MAAGIALGAFIGTRIDARLQTETPYATAAGALIGVFGGMYAALKDFF